MTSHVPRGASARSRLTAPSGDPVRVLVFPGGTESGLEIWRSLRWHRQVELYSAGAAVSNHAPYVFERHFILPMVGAPGWLERLRRLVERLRIDFIYPAHDDVIVALVENQAKIPAKVVTSPRHTCLVCRYKSRTYLALAGALPTPRVFRPESVRRFPVFVKPDRGQGSQGATRADSPEELAGITRGAPERFIITEYLPGDEFTVDCLSDHRGRLLYAVGRRRIRVRNGISVDTEIVERPEFLRHARAINRRLRFRGAWFYQLKADRRGRLTLLEVAPRIAGSMAIDRALGVNLPLLSLFIAAGAPVQVLRNPGPLRMDRALVNRFRHDLAVHHVYVDLDDTLVIRGRVNPELAQYLYQAAGHGVRLSLLTRHREDVRATLRRHRLEGLFDDILVVGASESKASRIRREPGAILIDDSFSERRDVARRSRIPTFDPSMVELLLDDRR